MKTLFANIPDQDKDWFDHVAMAAGLTQAQLTQAMIGYVRQENLVKKVVRYYDDFVLGQADDG